MAQVSTGLRSVLESPLIYNLFQRSVAKKDLWAEIVSTYFPQDTSEARVLDIGCGPGNFLKGNPHVVKHSNFVGIDPSRSYIESAQKIFPEAAFLHGTVRDVKLDSSEFDVVVISGVLHHVDDSEARDILNFASRHLVPAGVIVSVDPVVFDGQHPLARRMALADRGQNVRSVDELRTLWSSCAGLANSTIEVRSGYLRLPYNHAVCVGTRTNNSPEP